MTTGDDLLRLVIAVHALTRVAALETKNDAPAAQWRTLKLLRERGPLRVGDLATISRVSQPGMTRLVGQLSDAGLVRRSADATDARASVVEITDAGEASLDAWLGQLTESLSAQFPDLDAAEADTIRRAAGILEASLLVPGGAR